MNMTGSFFIINNTAAVYVNFIYIIYTTTYKFKSLCSALNADPPQTLALVDRLKTPRSHVQMYSHVEY